MHGSGSRDFTRECVDGGGCIRFVPEGPCVAKLEYSFQPSSAIALGPGAGSEGIWTVSGRIYEDETYSYSCTARFSAKLSLNRLLPVLHTREACAAAAMGINQDK